MRCQRCGSENTTILTAGVYCYDCKRKNPESEFLDAVSDMVNVLHTHGVKVMEQCRELEVMWDRFNYWIGKRMKEE